MEQIAITAKHLNESHTPLQYCIFDENGGTIGSDSTNNFCLQDTEIQERHVSIQYEEGCFTIASIGDSDIFYNESFSALRAGYETTINLGDTFRIGNYKFTIIDPKDIQEDFVDNKKILNEVARYNKLDTLEIKPRGQVSGLHLDEEKIEDILTQNKDYDDLMHLPPIENLPSDTLNMQHIHTSSNPHETLLSHKIQSHDHSVLQYVMTFLHDTIKKAPHISPSLSLDDLLANSNTQPPTYEELQTLLHTRLLIDSIPLINSLILAIITKESNNPIYDILDPNPYNLILNHILTTHTQTNNDTLQALIIQALHAYIKT